MKLTMVANSIGAFLGYRPIEPKAMFTIHKVPSYGTLMSARSVGKSIPFTDLVYVEYSNGAKQAVATTTINGVSVVTLDVPANAGTTARLSSQQYGGNSFDGLMCPVYPVAVEYLSVGGKSMPIAHTPTVRYF